MPVPHWRLRYVWHRWSRTAAYLLVAGMSIVALQVGLSNASESREALADSARTVVIDGCERDNDTRAIIRQIIQSGKDDIEAYVKEGVLTREQADRALKANDQAIKKLPDADCEAAAAQIVG